MWRQSFFFLPKKPRFCNFWVVATRQLSCFFFFLFFSFIFFIFFITRSSFFPIHHPNIKTAIKNNFSLIKLLIPILIGGSVEQWFLNCSLRFFLNNDFLDWGGPSQIGYQAFNFCKILKNRRDSSRLLHFTFGFYKVEVSIGFMNFLKSCNNWYLIQKVGVICNKHVTKQVI